MSNLSADLQERTETAPAPVEVRTDARLAAVVGTLAAVVAIAYLARAAGGGGWLDWALAAVTGAIAAAHLQALVDARVPRLVVDEQGARLRRGRTWLGLPWDDLDRVEHEPRRGLFRDGRVVLVPRDEDADVQSVPLSLATRVTGADGDLTAALERLATDAVQVFEVGPAEIEWDEDGAEPEGEWDEPAGDPVNDDHADAHADAHADDLDDDLDVDADVHADDHADDHAEDRAEDHADDHGPHLPDPRPALARGIGFLAARLRPVSDVEEPASPPTSGPVAPAALEQTQAMSITASPTPLPLRDPVPGTRIEVRFEGAAALAPRPAVDPDADPDDDPERTIVWDERVRPIATPGEAVTPLVIDDFVVEPAADPVVGPELAAARTRLGLSVDQLAERTRIRPHVIESIEVDDFAPCGGDFYARGHLRTLARVLGVDAAPLLAAYDERYADGPIDARRVFEAELATGADGPIRGTRGGPNWSVLVAAVMAVVLAWSIVRLVTDSPIELHHKPVLNGSPSSATRLGPPVPVVLTAAAGGAHVVVRDGTGRLVFSGDLAFGDSKTVKAAPPVRVQSSDGSLRVKVDGQDRGRLGADGQPAQNTFAAASR